MPIERFFSAEFRQLHDSPHLVRAGTPSEPLTPALAVPADWSLEAAMAFLPALCATRPATVLAIEENTTPSWLWPHLAASTETTAETTVTEVFLRIAGSATYTGWKNGLWQSETEASAFHDEVLALLQTRSLVLAPQDMAKLGRDWAYGPQAAQTASSNKASPVPVPTTLIVQNETIDSILRRSQPTAQEKWHRFLQTSLSKPAIDIVFADTMAEWAGTASETPAPTAALNMLAFCGPDGTPDLPALEQATRIAVLLLDLHYETLAPVITDSRPLALTLANMAALLMAIALPYDSPKACVTAAALCALVTATATATSALLAGRLGTYPAFPRERESLLRAQRNRLRAAFAEPNDFDRLSIIPQGLAIESGADLILISKARYALEEALTLSEKHGLRHTQLTRLGHAPTLAALLDSTTQGCQPETALTCAYALGDGQYERRIRPALLLGLEKVGYDLSDIRAIVDHVAGYKTLRGAPALSLSTLQDKGLTSESLTAVEALLPFVSHIRYAFTPWVLGLDFCRNVLGLTDEALENPRLDILHHLGFTTAEIETANAFCCGHNAVQGNSELSTEHAAIFVTDEQISHEARLRMAGAVQSFLTGTNEADITVPATLPADLRGEIIIQAWQLGLRKLRLTADGYYRDLDSIQNEARLIKRQTLGLGPKESAPYTPPTRMTKAKASLRAISLNQPAHKPAHHTKRGK
ncbi:MAG: hypothetical protein PHW63_02220 [Alphaproteobacteria bacterium]|nr:hypothetical protein [Alphaproteobacteria bacterium]